MNHWDYTNVIRWRAYCVDCGWASEPTAKLHEQSAFSCVCCGNENLKDVGYFE